MYKVLFFIESLEGGGAEKVLRTLVNNMDKSKFEITVKTLWPCDFDSYLADGIKFSSVYPAYNAFYHNCYRVEAALNLVYKMHVKGDYDIECAYLECGTTKIMSSSDNSKAVKLAWVHCDFATAWDNPVAFAKKSKKRYEKFDKAVCVSENVRESFVKLFDDSPKSVVVYNTVDEQEIVGKSLFQLDDDLKKRKLTVLSIGRLMEQKNYLRMLKACKTLMDEGFDFDLWILGKGEQQKLLEDFISENGLSDCVKLCGFRQNPYPAIKAADILACSSNYEGFSTFITEGLILGKPIVTTECSGMRELLGDSQYGLITDNDDTAFCDGLRKMLESVELRNNYAKQAFERGKEFSTSALVRDTEEFLIECLNTKRVKYK